ncbi:MAG: hypothetical protein U0T82_01775 [Bacteroidales bacterium]
MAIDFRKIKGLFVEEVEESPQKKTASKSKGNATEPTPVDKLTFDLSTAALKKGSVDNKILDSLLKAISDNNLPGEDYIEFMEALKAMKSLDLDDKIKFQTVMATLSTRGLTKEKIIDSANYYIKVLQNEHDKFDVAVNNEMERQVNQKKSEIAEIEKKNKEKAAELTRITEEIQKNQVEIGRLNTVIQAADQKIKVTANNFNVTFEFLVNQITSDIEKIKIL